MVFPKCYRNVLISIVSQLNVQKVSKNAPGEFVLHKVPFLRAESLIIRRYSMIVRVSAVLRRTFCCDTDGGFDNLSGSHRHHCDDDVRSGCGNSSQCLHKKSFSGLHSLGRSRSTDLSYDSGLVSNHLQSPILIAIKPFLLLSGIFLSAGHVSLILFALFD